MCFNLTNVKQKKPAGISARRLVWLNNSFLLEVVVETKLKCVSVYVQTKF